MEAQENNRARALIAIAAFAAFGVLIAGILVLGGGSGDDREFAAAPTECVDSWNGDEQAVSTGVHNSTAHAYSRVQVGYAATDGEEVSPEPVPDGHCVVVFAAQALDPEPFAAAQINVGERWVPMSEKLGLERLAALQSAATAGANANLGTDGRITPLEEGSS